VTAEPTARSRTATIGLVASLVLAMTAGTAMQFAPPILGPLLVPDLGMSRAQLGMLTSTFFLVGAIASPVAGRWADRVGGRRALVATFGLGALALVVMGLAPNHAVLLVASGLGGVAAAAANPATNRLILTQFPATTRGAVTGLKQSGVQFGNLLAGATLPALALAFGWNLTVILAGAVMASGIVLVLAAVPGAADRSPRLATGPGSAPSSPIVTALCTFAALMGLGIAAVITYLPIYAVERAGQSVTQAGLITAVIGGLGIAARLFWGVAADRLARPLVVLPIMALGAMVGVGLLAAAPWAGSWTLWAGAAVLGATALGWNGVAMLVTMTVVPREQAGWATGRVILWFYIGLLASPVPFGLVADRTGSYLAGWAGVTVAFLAAGIAMVLAGRAARAPA
jgi:MFS family permease